MTKSPNYDVFAIKYAEARRTPEECFLMPDPHEGAMEMDFFVWLIRGGGRTILVDTGFNHERAEARKRTIQRLPTEGLEVLGVKAQDVETVIVTHLHYDHAGNLDLFPEAEFIIQDEEVHFATGRYMRYKAARQAFEADDVTQLIRHNFKGRVRFVDGDDEL
ncbi:MAG: MBL fold metallo-hydrolase, partial [Paracoccaceae bacterium]|nr:MBL fold metallo-hydrolase [Paracoccaceae bacterium]